MRVRIVEGNFALEYGVAVGSKSLDWIVWLDILPDHPMYFHQREIIRVASSDAGKPTENEA